MTSTAVAVLDASALLAYVLNEPGAEQVAAAIRQRAAIGAVNWAEVLSKLSDRGVRPDHAIRSLAHQGMLGEGLIVHPVDEATAREIALLRPLTKSRGLGIGDRACLALARELDLPVLTTDRAWARLGLGVNIRVIR
ncbi:MAG: type II toxin-antitoxin system VapC family toxin [Gammaproteobacteria bacterium]